MTHNRSTDAVRDRALAGRTSRWTFRRRAVAVGACALTALSGGVAVAGNGGVSAENEARGDAPARTASNTLRPGSRGKAVKRLQRKLGLRADGVYGRGTKRAVKRFQKRNGLKADGIAGPETLRELGIKLRRHDTSSDEGSSVSLPAKLRRIAECESGGNPRAVSADGRYRGKFQFDMETWRGLGGKGDPADAPESTQDRLALKLYRQRGSAPWGACADA
jgi:hypothetical protein